MEAAEHTAAARDVLKWRRGVASQSSTNTVLSSMQRKSWAQADCPMARTVDLIGEWGSLLIVREAFSGVTRFDDFQERLQISRHLLTERLKKLVAGGVLARQPIAENGKRLEYILTPMGEDLFTLVVALRQWGDRWLFAPDPPPMNMVDAVDGSVVAPLEVKSSRGRVMARRDLRLKANRKR
jgi:DNA-binding HxlR family transcriptional regulator